MLPLLQTLTGQDYGTDLVAWQNWWADQLGSVADSSSTSEKPTSPDEVALPTSIDPSGGGRTNSCLLRGGTRSSAGRREDDRDDSRSATRVLSQNTARRTQVQPVIAVTRTSRIRR